MPPRRSESPEGAGDLLKQDSFGFEEDEAMQEPQGSEFGAGPAEMIEVVSKDESVTEGQVPANGRMPLGALGARRGQQGGQGARSNGQSGKGSARYFIVKSNNHSNIDHSIKNGIWATQKHNEDKLVDAFRTASHVYLIFSVNMSGHFQGYAKMCGTPFKHQQRYDLPFKETEHLTNPLNEGKPVKISRDGQELPSHLGVQLCRLFDEGADAAGVPRPAPAVRNPAMRAGPAVTGNSRGMGRSGARGTGMMGGRMANGMVMTPMGPMPAHMMMGGMMGGMPMMGMGGPGMMDEMSMMGMGHHMGMGMNPMMGGMNPIMGMGMHGRGPIPPPRPPPRSPPRGSSGAPLAEADFRAALNGSSRSREGGRSRDEDIMLRALELAQRGSRSPRRRYRSRSRSASPRRSRRRSHSRSRSRSRGRGRDSLLEMSYDDYLEAFKALKKAKQEKSSGGGRNSSGSGPSDSMAGMMGGMMGGQASGMPQMGMRPQGSGAGNMSEDDYVRVWQDYSKMTGRPFDAETVRGWYRQYKQFSSGSG